MKLFNIIVNDDDLTGMNFISLVESPAVMVDFLKFSKEEPIKMKFNDLKHIITGVVCLANTPIYRWNKTIGDYYVQFSKDTIEKMMLKYSKMGLNNSVDLQHNGKSVDGVYMIESFLVNKERGIVPVEFSDVPDGSWICSFKVENESIWNDIISSGTFNGLSLSGQFELEPTQFSKQEKTGEFDELIDSLLNN